MPPMSILKKRENLEIFWNGISEQQQVEGGSKTTDTHLMCADGCIPVHGPILAQASNIFKQVFLSQGQNYLGVRTVILPDFKVQNMFMLIQFLYYGYVNLNSLKDVKILKNLLSYFQVEIPRMTIDTEPNSPHRSILYYQDNTSFQDEVSLGMGTSTDNDKMTNDESESEEDSDSKSHRDSKSETDSECDDDVVLQQLADKKAARAQLEAAVNSMISDMKSGRVTLSTPLLEDKNLMTPPPSLFGSTKKKIQESSSGIEQVVVKYCSPTDTNTKVKQLSSPASTVSVTYHSSSSKRHEKSEKEELVSQQFLTPPPKSITRSSRSRNHDSCENDSSEETLDVRRSKRIKIRRSNERLASTPPQMTRSSTKSSRGRSSSSASSSHPSISSNATKPDSTKPIEKLFEKDVSEEIYKNSDKIYHHGRRCFVCSKIYATPLEASTCITEKHGMVRCYLCFSVAKTTFGLFDHYRRKHQNEAPDNTIICPYPDCKEVLSFRRITGHCITRHAEVLDRKSISTSTVTPTLSSMQIGKSTLVTNPSKVKERNSSPQKGEFLITKETGNGQVCYKLKY